MRSCWAKNEKRGSLVGFEKEINLKDIISIKAVDAPLRSHSLSVLVSSVNKISALSEPRYRALIALETSKDLSSKQPRLRVVCFKETDYTRRFWDSIQDKWIKDRKVLSSSGNVLFLCNPAGGTCKGPKLFKQFMEPLLLLSGVNYEYTGMSRFSSAKIAHTQAD